LAGFQLQADSDLSYGYALLQEGKVDEAILQYRKVLLARPDYAKARNNLGSALAMKGDLEGAAGQYRAALETTPDYPEAVHNLGKVLLLKGDLGGALACLDNPSAGSADPLARWNDLGKAFLQEPDWQCAIACYRQAININPRSADAYANLGLAFFKKAEIKEAMDAWQRSLEIKPDQLYVLNNLAWLLATTPEASLRNGAKAVALAKEAGQLSGDGNPMTLHTLAAAYAEEGSYGLAAVTARRGLELAAEQKNGALAATLQKEIQLYEAGAPARESATQGSETAPPKGPPQ
jgi:tetratricopeptide (TPR) repeat protein